MTLDCSRENMGKFIKLYEGSVEHTLECDINLPDYCSEVMKVLKCCVYPKIVSSKISGDRACADGNALVRVIYADENNNICTYEQSYPFSKYVQLPTDTNGTLFANSCVQYVNFRATGKRRIEAHASVNISFEICGVKNEEIISSVNLDTLQAKTDTLHFSTLICCESKQFSLNETVELPGDYVPVDKMIFSNARPILNEVKTVKDKILLKGEICVTLIYCSNENNAQSVKFTHTVPLNQVIEANGLTPECKANVTLQMLSDEILVRNDAQAQPRLIEINCIINAKIKAYEDRDMPCITDAYCIDGELNSNYESIEILNHTLKLHETITQKNTVDLSSTDVEKICCVWFDNFKINKNLSGGKLGLHSSIPLNIIALDKENKIVFLDREFDVNFEKNVDSAKNLECEASCTFAGCTVGSLSDGRAEIKAEFIVDGDVFELDSAKVLVGADLTQKQKENNASIIVYFPDENENLWNIAREFNTTVDLIKEENEITVDSVKSGDVLLIPVK